MQAREKRLRAAKLPYAVCFSSLDKLHFKRARRIFILLRRMLQALPAGFRYVPGRGKTAPFPFYFFPSLYFFCFNTLFLFTFFSFFPPPPPHTHTPPPHTQTNTHTYTALSNYLCVLRIDIFSPPARPIFYIHIMMARMRARSYRQTRLHMCWRRRPSICYLLPLSPIRRLGARVR